MRWWKTKASIAGQVDPQDPEPAAERASVRRINKIARHIHARSYLEIGIYRGATFNQLSFERKVGVDPKMQFDIAPHRREGVEFHELTSDRFFTTYAQREKFDIVFIDGLHTFHQSFRDFCNSLSFAHERTVWLIDDVRPWNVYSALPTHREAAEFHKREGRKNAGWNGDVYKLIFAIHDFFPTFSYVTLGNPEKPQTLVWNAPRDDFSPLLNSMEAIERLSFFDLVRREEILNIRPEDEGLKMFFAAVPGGS